LDLTKECNDEEVSQYHQRIGVLSWAVELGRVDICTEVSMMAAHCALGGISQGIPWEFLGIPHFPRKQRNSPDFPSCKFWEFEGTTQKFPEEVPEEFLQDLMLFRMTENLFLLTVELNGVLFHISRRMELRQSNQLSSTQNIIHTS